jgi:uncharacterized protein (TIGR00299 family) protein
MSSDPERPAGVHLHLDAFGGLAGDMFVAALLDLRPDLEQAAGEVARRAHPELAVERTETRDGGLRGSRVRVVVPAARGHGPHHYADYDALLDRAAPDGVTAARARDILRRLGEAEARVHGVALNDVHFHEIADWDSVGDILVAAWLLDTLNVTSASAGPLPLGSGLVKTQHGMMPVPAPATLELMRGVPVIDDGIAGERVTPTGAAILAHLTPSARLPDRAQQATAIGYGFGSRRLPGIANALRATLWEGSESSESSVYQVGVISFAIDDQTPEDLAAGLDRIRAAEGVVDVLQIPAFGKKGRMTARVEVLCVREQLDDIASLCLAETATIGVRLREERRIVLPRESIEQRGVRVKRVTRPGGIKTSKVEMDDLANAGDYAERERRRRENED